MVHCNEIPVVILNNGVKYPAFGIGTYEGNKHSGQMRDAIKSAIKEGYRLIDGALFYKNEGEIGEGICEKIKDGCVHREELRITSKLWNTFHRRDMVKDAFTISLETYALEYLDLYLMHWPMAFKECEGLQPKDEFGEIMYSDIKFTDTWKELEALQEDGLARSIGVSNFNIKQLNKLLEKARIRPVVNQIEVHPYLTNFKLQEFCESNGIVIEAYSPLGSSPDRPWKKEEPILLEDPIVAEIAQAHSKTPAQILLRYLYERGIIPIPKSINPNHIKENIDIWNFCLCPNEFKKLNDIRETVRYNSFDWVKDHPDYPFGET